MTTVTINLHLAENVKNFVNIVNRQPFDVDLKLGRHVVDAKSILGIFSLDLSKTLTLNIHSNDCADFLDQIHDFMV